MKEEIFKLREEGKSYNEIVKILGCSKGTIAYHLGDGQKDKTRNRNRNRRQNKLLHKTEFFKYGGGSHCHESIENFTYQDVMRKFGTNPKCYITGRNINLEDGGEYHLDHIVPVCKGGKRTLDNMGLTCCLANNAKRGLWLEEFLNICKQIADYDLNSNCCIVQYDKVIAQNALNRLKTRCNGFQRARSSGFFKYNIVFSYKDVLEKFGTMPKCYLTGKDININSSIDYCFDHIIPVSRGGDNSLTNLGIILKKTNIVKHTMLVDELMNFCKEVLVYNKIW